MPILRRLRSHIRPTSLFTHISYQSSRFFSPGLRNMSLMMSAPASWMPHCYPPTRRSDYIDVYQSEAQGKVEVPDPYAWLEKDGEERKRWLASQEALARNFLDSHPDRARLEEEIRASTDYEKVSLFEISTHRVTDVAYIGQCSLVHRHCETTGDGIGHITVDCSRNLV